jgi:hypothetical protein
MGITLALNVIQMYSFPKLELRSQPILITFTFIYIYALIMMRFNVCGMPSIKRKFSPVISLSSLLFYKLIQ